MISLCCCLNFIPNVVNIPSNFLHAAFSEFVNVTIAVSLSLASSLLYGPSPLHLIHRCQSEVHL